MSGSYYFIGLGSNIEPTRHFSETLDALQQNFGSLLSFPCITTKPVNMSSEQDFVNSVVVLYTQLAPEQLKAWTNAWEESLGRDRSDPQSARRDRAMDLDILAQQSYLDAAILERFTEPYVQAVIEQAQQLEVIQGTKRQRLPVADAFAHFRTLNDEPLVVT